MTTETVQIGKFAVPMAKALEWVTEYTDADANHASKRPYAYPAYDTYQASENTPGVLNDADLLAPVLLNVTIKVRSFYALQGVREQLEVGLSQPELHMPLAALSDDRIDALVGGLYSVLDAEVWGVKGTTLSKILHRKRPQSVALHDTWVKGCYLGPGAPVPRVKGRSWSDYMAAVSRAMAVDLREGADQFKELQQTSKANTPLTDLRLLDIIAWHVGRLGVGAP